MNNSSPASRPVPTFVQYLKNREHLELLRLGIRHFFSKNSYAFRAGDPADYVCVVERGHFKVFQTTPDGKDMLLFFRAPGEILGLRGLLCQEGKGNSVRTYSAQACEDSELLCIPADGFRSYLVAHPQIALEVAATLSRRLDDSCDNLSNLALTHVAARVARLILHTGQTYGTHVGKAVDLDIPLTQQEIADMVGAARQTVSSVLNSLYHEGVISVSHQHIRIENEERLRELALSNTPSEETGGNSPPSERRRTPR